jgi:hypothetical protein
MIVATDSRDFISQVPFYGSVALRADGRHPTSLAGSAIVARSAPSHVGERILYSIRPFAERL